MTKMSGKMSCDDQYTKEPEKLGIEPDWQKLRYYIFMDELF